MNINQYITKYNNIPQGDAISEFNHHGAQQCHDAYEIFFDFLEDIRPSRIIEIGTAIGGFTRFLKFAVDNLNLSTKITSFDVIEQPQYDEIRKLGVDVIIKDMFLNYRGVDHSLIKLIQEPGLTLVLCDGGNKVQEVNLLAPFIKVNDIIMAHDYGPNEEYIQTVLLNKIWNWFEIRNRDISRVSNQVNLIPFNQDRFQSVVWLCRQKQDYKLPPLAQ